MGEGHAGLGARLLQARDARGLSQRELAALAGITQAAVGRVETGTSGLSLETVERLALALEVSPGWLAFGEGEGP